jgi:hypothetical protein
MRRRLLKFPLLSKKLKVDLFVKKISDKNLINKRLFDNYINVKVSDENLRTIYTILDLNDLFHFSLSKSHWFVDLRQEFSRYK